jgi:hypothetical protein
MASEPLMREIRALMGEIRELRIEAREDHELNRREHELNRREHELNREQAARLAANYDEQLQLTREFMRRNEIAFMESRRVLAELVEEVKAQRGALFAIIDELRGGGASPATS